MHIAACQVIVTNMWSCRVYDLQMYWTLYLQETIYFKILHLREALYLYQAYAHIQFKLTMPVDALEGDPNILMY